MPANGTALALSGVTKRFGGLVAVDNVRSSLASAPAQCHHRTERRRQDDAVQSDYRRAPRRQRARDPSTAAIFTGLKPHQVVRCGIKRTLQIKSVFGGLSVLEISGSPC